MMSSAKKNKKRIYMLSAKLRWQNCNWGAERFCVDIKYMSQSNRGRVIA
jgi:hypothetical protein